MSVSVQLGILAIAKDEAHADLTDVETAIARATAAGHHVVMQQVVGDTEAAIRETLTRWVGDPAIDCIIVIASGESDAVSTALDPLVTAALPGFTDLFRYLMFQEQGASAMLSSAEAARCESTFVFVVPGAIGAAMDQLILPQFDPNTSGKNLLKQIPRLRTDVDAEAGVPTEIKPEKTQGGSGMPARLPASSGVRAQAHSTGRHVIQRGVIPDDPVTAPIDLERLEREIAAAKGTDDDVTKTTTLAAPPSKGAALAAKLKSTPTPVAVPAVTINPRNRNDGSKPPTDAAARARRASASLPKSGAPTTVRTKPPTEPPKGVPRGANAFSTQLSASPPPPRAMLDAPTTISAPKGMLGAETVIALTPSKSGAMPLDLDDEAIETMDAEIEDTGRFKKAPARVDEPDEKPTRPGPTKPPPPKTTPPPMRSVAKEALAETTPVIARKTPTVVPDDLPKERRNSGGLPRGTFNYPLSKKKMHPAQKVVGVLAILGLGFGAVVFAFRERKPETAVVTIDASVEQVATIDASVPVVDIDASLTTIATIELATDAAVIEPDAAVATKTRPGPKPVTTTGTTTGTTTIAPIDAGSVVAEVPPEDDCDETSCVAGNYDKPCCAKYKPRGPEIAARTESGLPQKLDRMAVRAGVDSVRARVTTCGEKAASKGTVKVHVTVSAEGVVTEASVESAPDNALGTCVATAMKSAKFAKSDEGGSFSYPFVF